MLLPLALWAFERAGGAEPPGGSRSRRRDRVDPALRPGAPGARRDPVLLPLRALPDADAPGAAQPCAAVVVAAAAAGLLVQHVVDRGLDQRRRALARARSRSYSADGARLRHAARPARERELRLPRLAGAAARARGPRRAARASGGCGLAAALGLGALVPILLALGTNLPLYSCALAPRRAVPLPARAGAADADRVPRARRRSSRSRSPRAPGPRWLVAARDRPRCSLDLHVRVYGPSAADAANAAYAAIARRRGELLELPVFLPDVALRQRLPLLRQAGAPASGRAATRRVAPQAADALARDLQRLNCGDWTGGVASAAARSWRDGDHVPPRPLRREHRRARARVASRGAGSSASAWARWRRTARSPSSAKVPPMGSSPPQSGTGPLFCEGWLRPTEARATKTMSAPTRRSGSAARPRSRCRDRAEPTSGAVGVDGRSVAYRGDTVLVPAPAAGGLAPRHPRRPAPGARRVAPRVGLTVSFRRMG